MKSANPKDRRFEELEPRATPAIATDGVFFGAAERVEVKAASAGRLEPPGTIHMAGDYYLVDGQALTLVRYADRLVVSFPPGSFQGIQAALTAPGGVLEQFELAAIGGFNDERIFVARPGSVAASAKDFAFIQARLDELALAPGVAWAAPVFHYLGDGSDVQLFAGNELNVALKPGVDPATYFGNVPYFGGYSRIAGAPDDYTVTVAPEWAGVGALRLAQWMAADPNLRWTVPNMRQQAAQLGIPNDPLFAPNQWHLHNTGQLGAASFIDADADLPEAWDSTIGSSTVVVAISDTGFEMAHPDLAANVWVNAAEAGGSPGVDDDGNGWIDDVNGWDFSAGGVGDNNPNPDGVGAVNAHGTAVAGIAGAVGNNGIGVAGTAQTVKLMNLRIFNAAETTTFAIAASATYYASGRHASGVGVWQSCDIQNASWGFGAPDPGLTAAYAWGSANGRVRGGIARGTVFAQAAGNGGAVAYPANLSATVPGVIAVGAADEMLRDRGAAIGPQLDVLGFWGTSAGIATTDRVGANGFDASDYAPAFDGTSAAAPLVAGVASLLFSTAGNYNATNAAIKQLLRDSADKTGAHGYFGGFNNLMGYGVVNAKTAVDRALGNLSGRAEVQALLDTGGALYVLQDNLSTIDFGVVPVGGSASATVRVYNWGSASLSVVNPTSSSASYSVSGFVGSSIAPGSYAAFQIAFAPTAAGAVPALIEFTNGDNDLTGPENERSFQILATGTAQVPSLSGTVFHDWDGDGLIAAATDPKLSGKTVYLDANNNSMFDFSGVSQNRSPNLAFGAAPTTVTDSIVLAGVGNAIDVDVTLNIAHTWDGDVRVTLTNPVGTIVTLIDGVGGAGDNFVNTVLDDEAAAAIGTGSAPFTGSFRPASPLAAFDNATANGTWTLTVTDLSPGANHGVLQGWTLSVVNVAETNVATDAQGFYFFGNLPNGTYRSRLATPAGFGYTTANNHVATIASPGEVYPGRNFGIARPNAIYGNVFEDWNGNGIENPNDGRLANWTTFLDSNNNGVIDAAPVDFSDAPGTAIVDNATVSASKLVAGVGIVQDLNVKLNITHTWDGDLRVRLQRPGGGAGDIIDLILNRGADGDHFANTVLDDEAALPIGEGAAPFTGSFRPEQPLSTFDGLNGDGTWTLFVEDQSTFDVGTLVDWTLTFNAGETTATTDAVGNFLFAGLAAANYNVRQILPAGFTRTFPVADVHAFALPVDATAFNKDFGNYRQQAIYGNVFDDRDANAAQNGAEGGLADWTVWDDANDNGVIDVVATPFTAAPGVAIGDATTTMTTQMVAGVGAINDLDVRIQLTHTFTADLRIQLRRPGGGPGDTIDLVVNRGASGDNFTNAVFDDEAVMPISLGAAPFAGSFRPEQPLSTFDGLSADGLWTLLVIDGASGDVGTIVDWTLTFAVGENSTRSDAAGNYSLHLLSVGSHRVKEVVQPTWARTVPVADSYPVNLTAGSASFGNVFGNTQSPMVTGLFLGGSGWSAAFRTAAGSAAYGYPAQTGAGQLQPLPWSTVNRFFVTFSEPVQPLSIAQIGVRGTNVPSYAVTSVTMVDSQTARIDMTAAFDTDWIILELAGTGGSAIKDLAGNSLAGAFAENAGGFPTTGAPGTSFAYRFKIVVGDVGRNGTVRNTDLNAVRTNLFVDIGMGGYDIFTDIDANGVLRNADLNAVRNHLFIDAPAVGPTRPGGAATNRRGAGEVRRARPWQSSALAHFAEDRTMVLPRRIAHSPPSPALDEVFADF